MKPKAYLNQDFAQIKNDCLSRGVLFEDEEFTRGDSSLAVFNPPTKQIYWRRASEISYDPQFFVGEPKANDIDQGDCWFIASAIAIAHYKEYLFYVVPKDQSFDQGEYCGAFHFRFWRYGEWIDVVIDDYLPVDYSGNLVYCKNQNVPNEFWCSLLEKAYAKVNGCYEFLNGGLTSDGIIDLTGGVDETFQLVNISAELSESLWSYAKKAFKFKTIVGASIIQVNNSSGQREVVKSNGLVANHAYAVTKAIEIDRNHVHFQALVSSVVGSSFGGRDTSVYSDGERDFRLVRVRNPWGNTFEWNGPFSDNSEEWNAISDDVKQEIGLVKDYDGEFWIPWEEFLVNFHTLSFVHIDMNSFDDGVITDDKLFKWSCKKIDGKSDVRSDTSPNYFPQYFIQIKDVDKEDAENRATLIVSFVQKDSVAKRYRNNGNYGEDFVRFMVFKVLNENLISASLENQQKIDITNSYLAESVGNSGAFTNTRSISLRLRLEPGYYVIVPMVYYNVEVNFLLRLFTEFEVGQEDLSYLDKDPAIIEKPDKSNENTSDNQESTDNSNAGGDYLWKYIYDPNYNPYEHLDEIYDSEYLRAAPHMGVDVVSSSRGGSVKDDAPKKKDPELFVQANFDCKESSTKNQCSIM